MKIDWPIPCSHFGKATTLAASVLIAVVLLSAAPVAPAEEKSLGELMPRIPPKTVAEAMKSFKLEHGFTMQLVSCEPDVIDPIDAAFDEHGRMYVVEMNDYPFLPEQRVQKYRDQRAETWGRIRLLTDTDGDGRMDKSVVFADKLRWPQSVCCSRGGVFVISPPSLYFMKDTDGDGVADLKDAICTGFNSSNVQALSNGLEWGRDNAIYFSSGIAGGELTVPARGDSPEYKFTPGRRDLRLDPETCKLTMVGGGQQFGHTIDDWGNRFICSNSNHIVHVTWPLEYLERNPLLVIPDTNQSIAREGAAAVVFRASTAEPWRLVRTARRAADPEMRKRLPQTELVPIGFFTSATGITVYRGEAYPSSFRGNVFIGDVGGNLIHRKTLRPEGISFVAERADENVEFLTSTDNWFRPVNFVNAPDGTLYILDMYRETIEHPASIPDDIKALVDLESGHDKGRIWRLAPPGFQRVTPPDLGRASTAELVAQLKSRHGWIRDTAQRLLVERSDSDAVPLLRDLLADGSTDQNPSTFAVVQMHALWTLRGLNALNADDVEHALNSPDNHLREHAIRLVPGVIAKSADLDPKVLGLIGDQSLRVRWQLAFTLGDLPARISIPGLRGLASIAAQNADLRIAWLSSCHPQLTKVTMELMSGDTEPVKPLLVELARLNGSASDPAGSIRLLTATSRETIPEATRISILLALNEGLRRRGTNVVKMLHDSAVGKTIVEPLSRMTDRYTKIALDSDASENVRAIAVRFVAMADPDRAQKFFPALFSPQTSPALQQATVKSLLENGAEDSFGLVLEPWKTFGPATRREVVDNLVQSTKGAIALITAVESGAVKPGEIERDKRQLLLNHPQASVREAAGPVLAEPVTNRKQVVADYQPALELAGDADRGRMLFTKVCLQCHRAGTAGHLVGPDLVSVQNKSPADLLVAILDPNREAQPNFQTYTVVTKQGKIHTGMISAETAASLTLKRAEAKEDVILRDTIDELLSNGVSLMPEGLEKDFNQQQLADIIAAIKSLQ